ncbi:hypothetical protein, conserved [Plasmodium gonderi]|uniref:Uncharacterized protein n=1 Tax=Plasmodium gonderi TaxID=77519 RepID=A0A1Y1JLF3_PLAGO|nr:hypothetical protein, conserved [Plasmodium gonderi]GAW82295.1 hypothetical protein, conserved [Plasmodium gonderi]
MQDTESKKVKMKFKLNYVDKKNAINLSAMKNDLNSRINDLKGSTSSPSMNSTNTQNNNSSGGLAKRSALEKKPGKNVTKNIKINLAGSGSINKSGNTINQIKNGNANGSIKNDNSSGSNVSNQKNINRNVNSTNKVNITSKVKSPNSANSESLFYSCNTNLNDNMNFNDSLNIRDGLSVNDNLNLHDSLSLSDSINLNDSLNINNGTNNQECLNRSGNVNDYANNNNNGVLNAQIGGRANAPIGGGTNSQIGDVKNAQIGDVKNAQIRGVKNGPIGGGANTQNNSPNIFLHKNKHILKSNFKIYYKNELIPFSFLYHKILTILKSHYNNHITNNPVVANKGISFFHIENMLINFGFKGVDINNHALLSYLASSKQIKIDLNEKRICYMNPYVDITNITSLLNKINKHGFLYGYEINDDLINTNKDIYKWINTLLYEKKIRCIRSNNSHLRGKLKCKYLPSFCDIYAKNKCDNCFYNLKGYIFFPLSYEHIEQQRYLITNDIKNLWDEITLPNLDNILKEYKLKSTNKVFVNDNVPKRKNREDKFAPVVKKMKRIYNTHLFTADEIKNEFIHKK